MIASLKKCTVADKPAISMIPSVNISVLILTYDVIEHLMQAAPLAAC